MTEQTEFRPIETAPARRPWPFALIGAAVMAAVIWVGHRITSAPAEARPVALSNVAAKSDPKPAAPAAVEPQKAAEPQAKAPEGPNVLGSAVVAAGKTASKLAMVAKSELDRELGRTHAAQKQAASYRKQIDDLQRQLNEARAQINALQAAHRPPPPTDQEQILQMLAPVLRSSNDGRP